MEEQSVEVRDEIKEKYSLEELRDINIIRKITKGSYKELGDLIDERKGTIPIFGYPLMSYSPNRSLNELYTNKREEYDP